VKLLPGAAVAGNLVVTATCANREPENKMVVNAVSRVDLVIMLFVLLFIGGLRYYFLLLVEEVVNEVIDVS
jgi:hypothetical protein